MSKKDNNAAAEVVAALKQDYESKLEILNGLDDTATEAVRAEAQQAVNTAKEAFETATKELEESQKQTASKNGSQKASGKLVKGKFLLSPTGKFSLAYNAGEEASLPELQANELKEAGYFDFI